MGEWFLLLGVFKIVFALLFVGYESESEPVRGGLLDNEADADNPVDNE
jgi:hypothetical protein